MRSHLNEVVESKSIFDNNNDARQEHLETSSYDLALAQLEHRNKLHHVDAPPQCRPPVLDLVVA